MRITTVIGTAVAAAALTLAFAQPASAATHAVATKKPTTYSCGSASNGLGVEAVSKNSKRQACRTAIKVANEYVKQAAAGKPKPFIVTVDGSNWKCTERQSEINPFGECTHRGGEKVKLFS